MKKMMLLILAVLMVFGLCSCEKPPHRKLQFEDGESFCFRGGCTVSDEYIKIGENYGLFNPDYPIYFSSSNREYSITYCDCENINK